MREVNFSIPNVNKASVGITTTLYDRRALDCTSTLPLINSLNHLAYLTTSSARIRDILTVDGGVERLVVILKEGRTKELKSMWKWNLAFQCVVNIGVRGSENVRTRVVEADMVPVIATILDNYIQVIDKFRSKAEAISAKRNNLASHSTRNRPRRSTQTIEIPHSNLAINTPRTNLHHYPLSQPRPHDRRHNFQNFTSQIIRDPNGLQPLANDLTVGVQLGVLQPVRDVDRLPSMLPVGEGPSQPNSPVTPNPPLNGGTYTIRGLRPDARPLIRHQRSMSEEPRVHNTSENESIVDIQSGVDMEREPILGAGNEPVGMAGEHGTDPQVHNTFNITHQSIDSGVINAAGPATPPIGLSPAPPTINPTLTMPGSFSRYISDSAASVVLPSMPREEDVLMSLQLLAYVSKYCNLRTYFQNSHLVPSLSIEKELYLLDDEPTRLPPSIDTVEEYLQPDDFNIFPLVEKFTVRHHPADMQYWAGVVMRNLCRKDDSRGGIRQCAYYECGKWEEYTRQFAKCRRCRRTKYCSKECQKSAWVYHRHWCVSAQS